MSVSTITLAFLLSSMATISPGTELNGTSEPATHGSGSGEASPPSPATSADAPVETASETAGPVASSTAPTATAAAPGAAETAEPGAPEDAIIVTGGRRVSRTDPLLGANVASFTAIAAVDKAVVGPTAKAYAKVVPKPVRNGLRNVIVNLAEPVVFLNYLLQFKPGKATETAGRFALNSTIGVAGLFDMARRKPFNLPYRPNGFANTFGYHGIKQGPYLFVPILGPTTARDLIGRVLDILVLPTAVGEPFNNPLYGLTTGVVKSLNDRVDFDGELRNIRNSSDPYAATRDRYLKRRQAEIDALHNRPAEAAQPVTNTAAPVTSEPAR